MKTFQPDREPIGVTAAEPRETFSTGWQRFMYSRPNAYDFPTLWGIEEKQVIPSELLSVVRDIQDFKVNDFKSFAWKQAGRVALVDRETRNNIDASNRSERIVAGQIRHTPPNKLLMGFLTYAAYSSHGKIIHPNSFDTLPFDTLVTDLESTLEDKIPYLTDPEKIAASLESTHPDVKDSIRSLLSSAFDQLENGSTNRIALKGFDFKNAFFMSVLEALSGDAPLVCVPKPETTRPFPYQGENGLVVSFVEDAATVNEPQTELGKWLVSKLTMPGGFAEMRERIDRLPETTKNASFIERLATAYPADSTLQALVNKKQESIAAAQAAQKEQKDRAWRDLLAKHKSLVDRVRAHEASRFSRLWKSTPADVQAMLVIPNEVMKKQDHNEIFNLIKTLEKYIKEHKIP